MEGNIEESTLRIEELMVQQEAKHLADGRVLSYTDRSMSLGTERQMTKHIIGEIQLSTRPLTGEKRYRSVR